MEPRVYHTGCNKFSSKMVFLKDTLKSSWSFSVAFCNNTLRLCVHARFEKIMRTPWYVPGIEFDNKIIFPQFSWQRQIGETRILNWITDVLIMNYMGPSPRQLLLIFVINYWLNNYWFINYWLNNYSLIVTYDQLSRNRCNNVSAYLPHICDRCLS